MLIQYNKDKMSEKVITQNSQIKTMKNVKI